MMKVEQALGCLIWHVPRFGVKVVTPKQAQPKLFLEWGERQTNEQQRAILLTIAIQQRAMGILSILALAVTHPQELRALVTYKVWRDPLNDIKANPEESGWNRESMQRCWSLLDLTSRSFASVIKELKGEQSRVICLFYLVLRALDTIEDDMTLDPTRKIKLLTSFYQRLEEPGWTFTESE
jgi:hypothetical protein